MRFPFFVFLGAGAGLEVLKSLCMSCFYPGIFFYFHNKRKYGMSLESQLSSTLWFHLI